MAGYLGAIPVPQATQNRESFTASADQTSFATAGYTVGFVDAFLNGVRLNTADFTATNGSDIVLAAGAAVNDILDVISYATFEVNAQTFTGTTTLTDVVAASLDISGNIDIDGITNLDVVDIDGAVNMATTLLVTGNVDFNGDLDVDGTTNLDVVDIDGAVNMATTLLVTGNVDFNGDLDVDGTTNLDVVDIDGTVNMAQTALVTGVLTTTAATVHTNGITMPDNAIAKFGTDTDMQIFHSGSTAFIRNSTGSLVFRTDAFRVLNEANSEQILHGDADGAVTLYHNNVVMLATNATGVNLGGNDGISILRAGGTNTHLTLGAMGASGTVKLGSGGVSNGTIGATRMTVKANGNVNIADGNLEIGTAGHGIDFSATSDGAGTDTSELLDDYEEGTFTPAFVYSTAGNASFGYAAQVGHYVKVGDIVHFQINVRLNAFTRGTGSGSLLLYGLPYTSHNTGGYAHAQVSMSLNAWTFNETPIASVIDNAAYCHINTMSSNATPATISDPGTSSMIWVSGTYRAA
jgi:cytoskeletal protein CcmA (bactofilin family)